MSNYDAESILQSPEYRQELAAQRTFMARVYGWMTIGMLATALVAMVVASSKTLTDLFIRNPGMRIGLIIVSFAVAMGLSFAIRSIPAVLAAVLFIFYSVLTGIMLSVVLLVYTQTSVASTFFVTAGMFGAMSVIGYTTKKDLTSMGGYLLMALIGLVLASIVNIFMQSSGLYWLCTFAGVLIFTGLTAYDTQKIKESYSSGEYGSSAFERTAIFGAFVLYLDFINLFLYMLRLLGTRKD
jgi:FtsH-binding integral membrane protein